MREGEPTGTDGSPPDPAFVEDGPPGCACCFWAFLILGVWLTVLVCRAFVAEQRKTLSED